MISSKTVRTEIIVFFGGFYQKEESSKHNTKSTLLNLYSLQENMSTKANTLTLFAGFSGICVGYNFVVVTYALAFMHDKVFIYLYIF